jgi:hypothetical protein
VCEGGLCAEADGGKGKEGGERGGGGGGGGYWGGGVGEGGLVC